jgi:hypothetical protein
MRASNIIQSPAQALGDQPEPCALHLVQRGLHVLQRGQQPVSLPAGRGLAATVAEKTLRPKHLYPAGQAGLHNTAQDANLATN